MVQKAPDEFHIRARRRQDLVNLREAAKADDTVHEAKEQSADYRFRIVCGCDRWRAYAETLAASVTYANFKGEISRSPDQRDKLSAYTEFHHSMYDYQSRPGT